MHKRGGRLIFLLSLLLGAQCRWGPARTQHDMRAAAAGLLVVAKHDAAHLHLSQQFKDRTVRWPL